MKRLYLIMLMSTCIPMLGMCKFEESTRCKDAPEEQEPVEVADNDEDAQQCEGPFIWNVLYLHEEHKRASSKVSSNFSDWDTLEAYLALSKESPTKYRPYGTLVVVLYADGCPPCAQLSEMIEEVAKLGITFMKVNVALCPEVAKRYFLGVVPHTIVFQNGKQMAQHVGLPTSADDLGGYIIHAVSVPSKKANQFAECPAKVPMGCAEE